MSWLSVLSDLTNNVGRGAEDVFSLGGTELARKYGGQGAKNILDPLATGLGANFEAGAVGGSGMLGAQGLGMGGSSAMTPYMPASTPNMGTAGSTLGPGGMSSPLNPMSGSAAGAGGTSSIAKALQMMRGMPMGEQGPQAQLSTQDVLQKLYKMFPGLQPGSHLGSDMNAMNGGSSGY